MNPLISTQKNRKVIHLKNILLGGSRKGVITFT